MEFTVGILGHSYSILGSQTLTFSDGTDFAYRFTDTGGIFGDKIDLKITSRNLSEQTTFYALTLTENGTPNLMGRLNFKNGYVAFSTDGIIPILPQWLKYAVSGSFANFYLPAEISSREASRFVDCYSNLDQSGNKRLELGKDLIGHEAYFLTFIRLMVLCQGWHRSENSCLHKKVDGVNSCHLVSVQRPVLLIHLHWLQLRSKD